MKHKLILLIITLISAITPIKGLASDARILKEMASLPGINYTYVGPAAMRFVDNIMTFSNISGLGIGLKKVKSLEVIECDNAESIAKLENFAKMLIKKNSLEVMTANETEDSQDTVYGIVSDNAPQISNLLVETRAKNSYTLIYIVGTIHWATMNDNFKVKNKKSN